MNKQEIAQTLVSELEARGLNKEEIERILYNNDPQNKQSQKDTSGKFLNLIIKS